MLKTVVLLDIFVETEQLFFSKEQHLFEIESDTFDQFKALLLNKSIHLWTFLWICRTEILH